MSTLTIRLPERKHQRLKQLAEARQISVNKLIEELALASHDAEMRFRALAASGNPERAFRVLDKLDAADRAGVKRHATS